MIKVKENAENNGWSILDLVIINILRNVEFFFYFQYLELNSFLISSTFKRGLEKATFEYVEYDVDLNVKYFLIFDVNYYHNNIHTCNGCHTWNNIKKNFNTHMIRWPLWYNDLDMQITKIRDSGKKISSIASACMNNVCLWKPPPNSTAPQKPRTSIESINNKLIMPSSTCLVQFKASTGRLVCRPLSGIWQWYLQAHSALFLWTLRYDELSTSR